MRTVESVARDQDDVVTRAQLRGAGVSHDVVTSNVKGRRWQTVGPRVVVLHNGPLTKAQLRQVAVLNAPGPVALAAATAAEQHGLRGFEDELVHVLVSRGARTPKIEGIKVHESRRFSDDDIVTRGGLPCVRVERALVDMALWARAPRGACAILAAGVQQRLTTAQRMLSRVDWPTRGNRCQLLRRTLLDIEGGAQALSELDFVGYCRRNALPIPKQQSVRRDVRGRRRYLDADFDGFSVEIDGAIHLRPLDAWADMDRHNSLVLINERQLRFPALLVYLNDQVVADTIRAALSQLSQTVACVNEATSA